MASPLDVVASTWADPADLLPVADIISTVEFDHTGNYLATGDKGGRVVLFERNETVSSGPLRLDNIRVIVMGVL